MRVAVVGSYYEENTSQYSYYGSAETFREACWALGQLLARSGHQLLIQFDDSRYADPYVLDGYLSELRTTSVHEHHRVIVARPQATDVRHFSERSKEYPNVISFKTVGCAQWDSARYRMCLAADATVVLGGSSRSEKTGYVVLGAGKTLVPIASFGGAAALLLNQVTEGVIASKRLAPPLSDELLSQGWSDSILTAIDEAFGQYHSPTFAVVHGHDTAALNELVTTLTTKLGVPPPSVMLFKRDFGSTLPEKWETLAKQVDGAIVLATPDDEGRLRSCSAPHSNPLCIRARQNVWLEYGWFWGRFLDRKRVLLLIKKDAGEDVVEIPSDAQGIEYFTWTTSLAECETVISEFVKTTRHSEFSIC